MSIRMLNTVVIICMALSIGVMLQPMWSGGFRFGFFALLLSTVAHIVVSHVRTPATDH